MEGEGNYRDNLVTERLWEIVKYEELYLKVFLD
jgi:hypothetical protein